MQWARGRERLGIAAEEMSRNAAVAHRRLPSAQKPQRLSLCLCCICCECSYASTQRYFSVLNLPSAPPSSGPQPVLIMSSGYGGDSKAPPSQLQYAERYGRLPLPKMASLPMLTCIRR